jgi:TetR/AcrR family transcriptional repressor of nem operon
MRLTLRDGTDRIVDRIAGAIEGGVADGSLPALEARPTAQLLYQLWLGASLIGKLHRNSQSLEIAMRFTRQLLTPESLNNRAQAACCCGLFLTRIHIRPV